MESQGPVSDVNKFQGILLDANAHLLGKTILVSRIIDWIRDIQIQSKASGHGFPVIYFYFKHLHENKRQMSHLLLSILSQLAQYDVTLLDFLYREISSLDQQALSPPKLCELASTALRAQRRCFVIVDGLDECGRDPHDRATSEVVRVLEWFEGLMPPKEGVLSGTDDLCIRLLISGQRDGHIEQRLEGVPSIQLESIAGHGLDIMSYTRVAARKICQQFSASQEVEQDIVSKITGRANGQYIYNVHRLVVQASNIGAGMFLFAKIVLANLSDQVSTYDLEVELEAENFPEGLKEA